MVEEELADVLVQIRFTDRVSHYLVELFKSVLAGQKVWRAAERLSALHDPTWPDEFHEDLQRAAKVLASAWRYQVPVPWDAEDLRASLSKQPRGLNMERENELLMRFPPISSIDHVKRGHYALLRRPGIFVDTSGHILAWMLPQILTPMRQSKILRATQHLREQLKTTGKKGTGNKLMIQWRTAPTFYQDGQDWPAGSWLGTPGGYAVGHKTAAYTPRPSVSLDAPGSLEWCKDMKESGALLSAILRVCHPKQYEAGRTSLLRMATLPRVAEVLPVWPSIFNTVQIISNRASPFHRDTAGEPSWYDLLVALGTYPRAELVLRNLGVQLGYKPGTIALFCAMIIHHGVGTVPPDRLCFSWFMSSAVHTNFGVPAVPWMYSNSYPM